MTGKGELDNCAKPSGRACGAQAPGSKREEQCAEAVTMDTGTKSAGPQTEDEGGEQPGRMGYLKRSFQLLLAELAAGWKQH